MLIIRESDIATVLPMRDVIGAVEDAFVAHARGEAHFPLRAAVFTAAGLLGSMPGVINRAAEPVFGAKLVTFFRNNAARSLHTHHAVIALFSAETGVPIALLDGRYITEVRTAAASAVATRALARKGPVALAIIGTGVQARSHVKALADAVPIEEVRVWGRSASHSEGVTKFARECGLRARTAASVEEACREAAVICTVTASTEPVVDVSHVESGAHVNAVGACTPNARELSAALVARARIFADSLEGALSEAGDIILAIRDGALPVRPDISLLGHVLNGAVPGRRDVREITLFESLGVAIEDLACAALAYDRARTAGLGITVEL
ncbi:MAG: ornithine cyclodeaminase family protein [Candidatus Eremiobacteraeota bacterium]|nr:ornithine cyclodeaminase family protein [Candidatus Eremiobacteraeota bacterium]